MKESGLKDHLGRPGGRESLRRSGLGCRGDRLADDRLADHGLTGSRTAGIGLGTASAALVATGGAATSAATAAALAPTTATAAATTDDVLVGLKKKALKGIEGILIFHFLLKL